MSVDYDVKYRKDGGKLSTNERRDEACFSSLGNRGDDAGKWLHVGEKLEAGKDTVEAIIYYTDIACPQNTAEQFMAEMREAMPELPWPDGSPSEFPENGARVDTTKHCGQAIVGTLSVVRYLDEETRMMETYFGLRKIGVPIMQALYLAHYVQSINDTEYMVRSNSDNSNHAILPGHSSISKKEYTHFVGKKWVPDMLHLPLYNDKFVYSGIFKLFAGFDWHNHHRTGTAEDVAAETRLTKEQILTLVHNWG